MKKLNNTNSNKTISLRKGVYILIALITFAQILYFQPYTPIGRSYPKTFENFDGAIKRDERPKSKRWAIMMIGGARLYAFTRDSFLRNVVNQTDPPMDLFVSTSFSNVSLFSGLSGRLLEMDSTKFSFDEHYNVPIPDENGRTKDRFQREQVNVLQMIDDYAAEQNITYDYIFYARPDSYYEVPFNISNLEALLEEENSKLKVNRSIFIPTCCNFFGWCDRLAVAPYDDFARMVRSTDEWLATGRLEQVGSYERAFKDRCMYNNLNQVDMPVPDNYAFFTARFEHAARACAGESDLEVFWPDSMCNGGFPPKLDTSVSMCKFFNLTTWVGKG